VKCDQTRPSCMQCMRTGRACDGYASVVEKSSLAAILATTPSLAIVKTAKEHRSLLYFENRTAIEFSGWYDGEFWSGLVLQTSSSEACVRHALLALGSLHEAFQTEFRPSDQSNQVGGKSLLPSHHHEKYAAYHYVKAIELLNTQIITRGWLAVDVLLLCCILCVSYEWLRGSYADAQVHLISGLRVLRQWSRDRASSTPTSRSLSSGSERFIRQTLMPIYTRYALQAKTSEAALPWDSSMLPSSQTLPVDSLKAARDGLITVLAQIYLMPHTAPMQSAEQIGVVTVVEQPGVATLVEQWHDCYAAFLNTASMHMQSLPHIRLLDAAYAMNRIILMMNPMDDQMLYDAFTEDFARVLPYAELFVASGAPAFSVDIAVIPVLYLVSLRCRDPGIRRRAIELNRRVARREGVWDSRVAARVGEEIVRIEEEGKEVGGAADVVEFARVKSLTFEADLGGKKVVVKFQRVGEVEWSDDRVLTW
jgi:hypothetical protein